MRDLTMYTLDKNVFFSGAERKEQMIIDGEKYIVKFQKNTDIGLVFNHVSEYLGSNIFELVKIPVQKTFLAIYNGCNVVAMKNFIGKGETLVPFNGVGESSLERDKDIYRYSYEDIQNMLIENVKLTNVTESINRFWDMFIIDALNGNFDRHGGNWGFIKRNDKYYMAPVYDNASSMYPRLNTDERLKEVLSSQEEINKRIFNFPTSHIKMGHNKSSYFEVINSLKFEECNKALIRMYNKIDLNKIYELIDTIEGITATRLNFYKIMYLERYNKIIKSSYDKLTR